MPCRVWVASQSQTLHSGHRSTEPKPTTHTQAFLLPLLSVAALSPSPSSSFLRVLRRATRVPRPSSLSHSRLLLLPPSHSHSPHSHRRSQRARRSHRLHCDRRPAPRPHRYPLLAARCTTSYLPLPFPIDTRHRSTLAPTRPPSTTKKHHAGHYARDPRGGASNHCS